MHIVLVSIGTLLVIPTTYLLFAAAYLFFFWSKGTPFGGELTMGLIALITSACTSGLAWSSLCLLFFKRTNGRWQRVCWTMVSVAGWITAPSTIGWWFHIASEIPAANEASDIIWIHLVFLFIAAVALQCGIFGARYARNAGLALRIPPSEPTPLAD